MQQENKVISLRLTDKEFKQINKISKLTGVPAGAIARGLIRFGIKHSGTTKDILGLIKLGVIMSQRSRNR